MSERVAEASLVPGDHGTTFGGNPLACAGINAVLAIMEAEGIVDLASQAGAYLEACLEQISDAYDFVVERRGLGLLQGLECRGLVAGIINNALENGLVLINAGERVLRFIPPLVISKEQIDEMVELLDKSMKNENI
jgi:acetylornithine/N-succinyldiaminopimelate aminotransferase